MTTEQQLKSKCTPDIIKRMVELAVKAGAKFELSHFEGHGDILIYPYNKALPLSHLTEHIIIFPLLLHRAVEGWNKLKHEEIFMEIVVYKDKVCLENYKLETHNNVEDYYKYILIDKNFKNYQPKSLTQAECAMLHCLLDVFEQEESDE